MKKRISLLLLLVFVAISGFSVNQQLVNDPPIILPPFKVSVIQIVQDGINMDKGSQNQNQSVSVLQK
ncbi:MAG: hypothetical protein WCG93_14410 [Paludibacter sp.]